MKRLKNFIVRITEIEFLFFTEFWDLYSSVFFGLVIARFIETRFNKGMKKFHPLLIFTVDTVKQK